MRLNNLNTSSFEDSDQHRERNSERSVKKKSSIENILEILIYLFFVTTFLVKPYVIPSGSMADNLLVGDHILLDQVVLSRSLGFLDSIWLPQKEIQREMVISFKAPLEKDKLYVKRVIGMPGDIIRIIYKKVYVNGLPLKEPYAYFKDKKTNVPGRDNFPQYRVPAGHFFCLGDNRDRSSDSRHWGVVSRNRIVGAPWRIYWSFRSTSERYLATGFLPRMRNLLHTIIKFFPHTRWKRTTKRVR